MVNEVIRTSGDIRRFLAQTMVGIVSGEVSIEKVNAVAKLAGRITESLQGEVNSAKVRVTIRAAGVDMGKISEIGKQVIEDAGAVPTLSGASEE